MTAPSPATFGRPEPKPTGEYRWVYLWGLGRCARCTGSPLSPSPGREPGTLEQLEGKELPRTMGIKLSPYQTDLREVLALPELRDSADDDDVLGHRASQG